MCELLGYAPRIGPVRVNRILRRADVWPLREVGRLTVGQRERIVAEIGDAWTVSEGGALW